MLEPSSWRFPQTLAFCSKHSLLKGTAGRTFTRMLCKWVDLGSGLGILKRVSSSHRDQLLERCQEGDTEALETLYRLYARRVFRLCFSLLRNEAAAEDMLQATFMTAFRKIHTYDHTCAVFTWLSGIAVRLVANERRAVFRRNRLAGAVKGDAKGSSRRPTLDLDRTVDSNILLQRVAQALEKLPEKKRLPFVLYHMEGMKLAEIAKLSHASVQTTFARIQAARKQILEILNAEPSS